MRNSGFSDATGDTRQVKTRERGARAEYSFERANPDGLRIGQPLMSLPSITFTFSPTAYAGALSNVNSRTLPSSMRTET